MTLSPVQQFCEAMVSAGIVCREEIVADGKLHRFKPDGDKSGSKNGWYVLFTDGVPAGNFGSWKIHTDGHGMNWCSKSKEHLSSTEKQQFNAQMERVRTEREAELTEKRRGAKQEAASLWHKGTVVQDHPYLTTKGVSAHGLKSSPDQRNALMVPIQARYGAIHGLQVIYPDGTKRFLPGSHIDGGYYLIGDEPTSMVYVAEGFSTGATIHEATDDPVAVAFNAGNLTKVAAELVNQYSNATVIICADNDTTTAQKTGKNTGIEAAKAAANTIRGSYG